VTVGALVPTLKDLLADPAIKEATYSMTGDQKVNETVFDVVPTVSTDFVWAPFQDVVTAALQEEIAGAASQGDRTLRDGFNRAQDRIVAYAQEQGFTVA
jgi:multiple sugar transport system substrate-binding protein